MEVERPDEAQQQPMVVNIVPTQIVRYDMVCRVCGNENDKNVHIFGADGQNHNLALKMNAYLPIKVADDDHLPSNCCWNCASSILSWHELVVTCAETDKKLKELQIVIAKPLAVPIESLHNEPEVILPHTREQEVTSVSLSAFFDANIAPEPNLNASEVISHEIVKRELKSSEYVQENAFQVAKIEEDFPPIEVNNKKLLSKPNILKANKVEEASKYDFACEYCSAMFVRDEDILRHVQERHPNEIDLSEAMSISQGAEKKEKRKHTKIDQETANAAKVFIDGRVYYKCKVCGKILFSPYTYLWHIRIHTGERPYICDLCGKRFRVSQGLARHLRETHQGIKKFDCDLCGRMFSTRRNVEEHRRIHTNERPYVCDLCGKAFKQKASLFVHNRSHTDHFPYRCTYCDLRFRTKPPLLVHVTRHTGEKPYPCAECGRCFRVKYELKRHMLVHSDEKPFACAECGLNFRQKRYLRNHMKTNHNHLNAVYKDITNREEQEDFSNLLHDVHGSIKLNAKNKKANVKSPQQLKKHICDVCDKVFSRNNVLTHHKRRFHTGLNDENVLVKENPDGASARNSRVFCDMCDKSFSATGSLVRHKRNFHDGLKQRMYRCKTCQEEFTDKTEYFSHIRLVHFNVKKTRCSENEKPFPCSVCDVKFTRKSDLKKHTKHKHTQRSPRKKVSDVSKYIVILSEKVWYQCDLCENRYKHAYNLARHRSVHVNGNESHVCAICGKQYHTKAGLRRHHIETHTMRRFTCKTCGAKFRAKVSLIQHMNIHSDSRPFACDACGKRFRQDSSLRVHKLYHTSNFRYCCDVCGKRYRRNNELKVHMTLHTGAKPYTCGMCEKAFRLSSTLRQHVKAHARLEECSCDVCGSTFSQMRYLNNHKRCHIECKEIKN